MKNQHDDNFVAPEPGDGPSLHPSETFFLRKLGDDLAVTGQSLRLEEYGQFARRRAGMAPGDGHTYSRRDFFALCRGENIVGNATCQGKR